jgi:hypothetical protein
MREVEKGFVLKGKMPDAAQALRELLCCAFYLE